MSSVVNIQPISSEGEGSFGNCEIIVFVKVKEKIYNIFSVLK